jgi:uncharacterized membrane protein
MKVVAILKRFALWLIQGVISAVILLFFVYMLFMWLSGCGETYVDGEGVTHMQTCDWSNKTI